jgi:hypothetical protein
VKVPPFEDVLASLVDGDDPSASRIRCASASKSRGRPLGDTALAIRDAVEELTGRFERMTVRQVYYQLEAAGVVAKTEAGYRQVQQNILKMRREGELAWGFIADGTRWQRKPSSWYSMSHYIASVSRSYRRDLWQRQHARVEVWLEKDALADVVYEVTHAWDVPLMVSRGQSSATFLHSAQQAALEAMTQTFVYLLYDFDAGGNRAARTIERELGSTYDPVALQILRDHPEADVPPLVSVERLAVTEQQVTDWGLPTRPAKTSDPEAHKNPDWAVELDAIDPDTLKQLVQDAILRHVDARAWEVEEKVEAEEREGLLALASAWRNGNGAA